MASGNAGNVHFYKSYYQAGNFSIFQDPLDDGNFAVRKYGDEKAFYISEIFKNKKAAKSFVEGCEVLKNKTKQGIDDVKDAKMFADHLNANCK